MASALSLSEKEISVTTQKVQKVIFNEDYEIIDDYLRKVLEDYNR